ncbi:DEAD/DEAH box helicase family protein [Ferroacidibacillus organovorans]|uniref:Helicase ATP-binding domain-containing protein n=1 Tax=Ferroacidibacillus organovorans TaxID=1765683 RepID=A0A101XQP1_9BACL|nr:DEAD/DEAH box helicase family protein [Ferroacidibacillus organovorans]KUO95789.1 hypothetical protein ATW55_14945 [Ferroacidibacillus organovorans]
MAFKSRYKGKSIIDSPEALFNDLKNRSVQGLLSHQADILRDYQEHAFNKKDVALELPTGSGKTLIGLLIGEFRRRANNERIVYLCLTRQLVHQVVEQSASKYGIKTNAFVGRQASYDPTARSEYSNSEAIAVTTYNGLFNINPVFYNPDVIILDDAHAAENYVTRFWSVSISRSEQETLYKQILSVIRHIIPRSQYIRMESDNPSPSDRQWVEKVPTPKFFDIIPTLIALLDEHTQSENMRFAWSLIRDQLSACHLYLSWNEVLIRPLLPPSLVHEPFNGASQRIYMSATLGSGGDLERITGVQTIHRLAAPKGWDKHGIGRRLFFFPEVSLTEDKAEEVVIEMTRHTLRTLVLVPDFNSANSFRDVLEKHTKHEVFDASDLEKTKDEFLKSKSAVAILANRFEGIDLFGDECRLLVVKGLPRTTNLHERFLETRMASTVILNDRIRTRIVQAIGRCTRSATDYAAVCVLGQELTDSLLQSQNIKLFHPELQAELQFGYAESKVATPDDYLENLDIFLIHGSDWDEVDQEIVARRDDMIKSPEPAMGQLLVAAKHEVDFQYAMWREDYVGAVEYASRVLQSLDGDDLKGYRGFWYYLAGSAAWLASQNGDPSFASVARQRFSQAASCTHSVTWLRTLGQHESQKQSAGDPFLATVIENLESVLQRLGTSSDRKFEKRVHEILNDLNGDDSALFENAHVQLGRMLGYQADNSDETAGPDPWWIVGDDLCIVAEDKTEGDQSTPVGANKVRQAVSHPTWIRKNVQELNQDARIISAMITTAKTINKAAMTFVEDVSYWHIDDFRSWAEKALGVVRQARLSFTGTGDEQWRSQAMQMYRDAGIDPLSVVAFLEQSLLSNLPTS